MVPLCGGGGSNMELHRSDVSARAKLTLSSSLCTPDKLSSEVFAWGSGSLCCQYKAELRGGGEEEEGGQERKKKKGRVFEWRGEKRRGKEMRESEERRSGFDIDELELCMTQGSPSGKPSGLFRES
ncbi:hypothetical protein NQZ68_032992 [Dissostichus eleginoides]|nr:hypothetical protein NQZ68_032992 [Dissostichus eleginoides]